MMGEPAFRSFKEGSWDLRRQERRRRQDIIAFPDRRQADRRAKSMEPDSSEPELTWITVSSLNE